MSRSAHRPASPSAPVPLVAPTGLRDRLLGILNFDDATYDAVKIDPAATGQALLIVGGTILVGTVSRRDDPLMWQLLGPILSLLAWLFGTGLTYLIGTRLVAAPAPSEDDWLPLLRLLGWTQISSLGGLLRLVPTFGVLLSGLASLYGLLLDITAIKTALGVSTKRALATSALVSIPEIALFGAIYLTLRSWGWA
jgi:hypothetical protein